MRVTLAVGIVLIPMTTGVDVGSATAQLRDSPAEACPPVLRSKTLRELQVRVLRAVPHELDSLEAAVRPGAPLAGYRLAHGHVVLADAGVVLGNRAAQEPLPQLLFYTPSPRTKPSSWLDFDVADGPYRLVGWGYLSEGGSEPPRRRCIAPAEWFIHEAGWHLMDGGMRVTPGAEREPPRPAGLDVFYWHPRAWDLHLWIGEHGEPTVAFANPSAPKGGLRLPANAFILDQEDPGPREQDGPPKIVARPDSEMVERERPPEGGCR